MEARIYLSVPWFQLVFQLIKGEPAAWVILRAGTCFEVSNICLRLETDSELTQNWKLASAVISGPNPIQLRPAEVNLFKELTGVVSRFYLESDHKEINNQREGLIKFLDNGQDMGDQPFLFPRAWKNKSLRVPVDIVGVSDFQLHEEGFISASIRVGDYLVFREQVIFINGQFSYIGTDIKDERIVALINDLLCDSALKMYLSHIFNKRASEAPLKEFATKASDYDREGRILPFVGIF